MQGGAGEVTRDRPPIQLVLEVSPVNGRVRASFHCGEEQHLDLGVISPAQSVESGGGSAAADGTCARTAHREQEDGRAEKEPSLDG